MNKFSRNFFILFIIVTAIPLILVIVWNIYTTRNLEEGHIYRMLDNQVNSTLHVFQRYLEDEQKNHKRILNVINKFNPGLKDISNALEADYVFWIDSENNPPEYFVNYDGPVPQEFLKLNKNLSVKYNMYYDTFFDSKSKKDCLYTVSIVPIKHSRHAGAVIIQKVPVDTIAFQPRPNITTIYAGNKVKRSNIIFENIFFPFGKDPKFFDREPKFNKKYSKYFVKESRKFNNDHKQFAKELKPFDKKHPPGPGPQGFFDRKPKPDKEKIDMKDIKLVSEFGYIKNNAGDTVAIVETSFPMDSKDILMTGNPMLSTVFQKIYLLGALIPLLGLILSLIAGYLLKKEFINPIENLSKVSQAFKNGNSKARVNTNIRSDELKETLINFNKMLDEIIEKEQLKDGFITNLTHDLRIPLIAEEKALELLVTDMEKSSSTEHLEMTRALLKNNQHLLGMVNQLLEIIKFDHSKLEIKKNDLNIKTILEQSIEQLMPLIHEKSITLTVNLPENIPTITGDYNCIKRCFLNILLNAIENISKGSKIDVSGKQEGNYFQLTFTDNGPGIADNIKDKLFDKFYASTMTDRKIGSGLGLYICKKFIDAHSGKIHVESKLGEFSSFIIDLPCKERNSDVNKSSNS